MSLELTEQLPINPKPLVLEVGIPGLPFDGVRKFDISSLSTDLEERSVKTSLLLSRKIQFGDIAGSFEVYGDLRGFKRRKTSRRKETINWSEKKLPKLPLIFLVEFDIAELWQYLLLQNYQMCVDLHNEDFFLHCDGNDIAVTEDEIKEKIHESGIYVVRDFALKEDTLDGTHDVKNAFPPEIAALSFLKTTIKPYPEEDDQDDSDPVLPPDLIYNKKLVLA